VATHARSPADGAPDRADQLDFEAHRRELTGYCYRMLGAGSEAEDAVQETMIRAWRNSDRLQADAALRSWLYSIATNVCVDMLRASQRRARPMEMGGGPSTTETAVLAPLPEHTWLQPIPDSRVLSGEGDPAELAAERETIKLAFVAALQHLPARQRAVLILREVLKWKASEVAELLDTSVASVNSALQRARATIDQIAPKAEGTSASVEDEQQEMLRRYVDAFERYDVSALVALLHEDATFSMPPHDLWIVGPQEVAKWMLGPGIACSDARLLTTWANGSPAVGIYKNDGTGTYRPFNLAVLEVQDGRITDIYNYLYPEIFTEFGFPELIAS
jgi:RNA polymerase sigma-70 factor (ECF subfamily)